MWKYYKHPDEVVAPFAFAADGSQDEFIPSGLVLMSDAEALEHVERMTPSVIDTAAIERQWRDAELASLVWARDRHRDQLEIGVPTTLMPDQFAELLVFLQALRDWPQSQAFPDAEQRPVAPAFLSALEGMQ
ncbi:hypothetical protein ACFW6U_09670 [Pseudomonas guariconensis]|uniref:hypothetical protein n=1 Tax=Pseudomonas guariconensis TaxID=1288410 RepID=UPI0034D4427B